MKTDEELMVLYTQGDYSAFEKLYARHKGKVYGYLKSRTPSGQAEDLFQAVFSKLHRKKHLYKPEFPFLPWFFTLIKNTLVDYRRKEKVVYETLYQEPSSRDVSEDARMEASRENLGLEEEQYRLLYLKFVEGREYKELEREFQAGPQALRKRVSRALRKLRGEEE